MLSHRVTQLLTETASNVPDRRSEPVPSKFESPRDWTRS